MWRSLFRHSLIDCIVQFGDLVMMGNEDEPPGEHRDNEQPDYDSRAQHNQNPK
jgi:hypothetical protein